MNERMDWEQQLYLIVDDIKELFSQDIWANILMDCSKNELLVMWVLYRRKECNMSLIAQELHVPLNTATGIISRMEKRELVKRERSSEDKRVVTICLSSQGEAQILAMIREVAYYGTRILAELSEEEIQLFIKMFHKVIAVFREERSKEPGKTKVRRIVIE